MKRHGNGKGIQAIGIGFGLLDALMEARRPISLGELSNRAEMAPSKARFYLISFVRLGLVNQDPGTGLYSLGPGAIRLGLTALEQFDVIGASKSAVHELANKLGFSTYLFVWGTHGPTMVYRADGKNWTSLDVRVGSVLPLLNSAAGRAYLACLPRSMTETLVKKEIRDIREHGGKPPSPEQIIRATRAAGIASARASLLAEITAIALPVLDYSALPAAVISIAGRIGRFDDSPKSRPARLLKSATAALSRQIGFRETM
jgi:DNA-binding IclR family transcriptional regulator